MMRIKMTLWGLFLLCFSNLTIAQKSNVQKLTIDNLFELAEMNSKSLRVADISVQEAAQKIEVSRNSVLPSLDISLSASYLGDGWLANRNFSNGQNAAMLHFGNNFTLEASQVVYAGGVISNSIEMAKLNHQVAQLDKEKNRQDIRFLLVANYLDLFKLSNQEEVYLQNIEQTRRLLLDIKAKRNEGLALKNDITRYELQLKSLELVLEQVKNSEIILNNKLVTILGLPSETSIKVDTSILADLPSISPEGSWQDAAINTPVVKQAQLGIEQNRFNEKIVKGARLPSLVLFAGDHLDGPITIEVPPINRNFNYWYVGVGLKFNIASSYKSGRELKLAKVSTQKAMESERLLRDNIQTDVKAAYVHFVESFTIYETQIKSLELASENYAVVNNQYLSDLALITDMLDASNSKLSAELQLANARVNILFNYFNLKRATGTL